jgi:CheY-like chemotaxis protein
LADIRQLTSLINGKPRMESSEKQQHRILIVDDNEANCELLEAYLADLECVTAIASDGQQAMEQAAAFKPDLILLDIMMPKLNGFEVCEKIRQDPQLSKIMILMVTALNELGDIERAVNAGTNDFLAKPVNRVELLKRVENMLELKGVSDENERLRQYIQRMEEDR